MIACSGKLTLGDGDEDLRLELTRRLDDGARRIVLDLTGLTYMDSAGVGELVAGHKRALDRAAVMKVVVSEDGLIQRIFAITGLARAVELFTDVDEAVASFR